MNTTLLVVLAAAAAAVIGYLIGTLRAARRAETLRAELAGARARIATEEQALARNEELLRQSDIALLPLERNRFNNMKSDLKFIECAGNGTVALASPVVYSQTLIEGQTGLLYYSPADFEQKLAALVQYPQLRQTLAHNAYQWVAQNRLMCQHYRQRDRWYRDLRDRLPELNAALRRRLPELF